MDVGNIPFIGATDSNNGITGWIATPNSSFDQNVLGVNYNGSVVENFYHVYGCVFSDDVKRLHLRNHSDNKFILLFCKVAILQQKGKYTYGYKFNGHRMERQKILLPVNEHGHPDYDYMERYGRKNNGADVSAIYGLHHHPIKVASRNKLECSTKEVNLWGKRL